MKELYTTLQEAEIIRSACQLLPADQGEGEEQDALAESLHALRRQHKEDQPMASAGRDSDFLPLTSMTNPNTLGSATARDADATISALATFHRHTTALLESLLSPEAPSRQSTRMELIDACRELVRSLRWCDDRTAVSGKCLRALRSVTDAAERFRSA